MAENNNRPEPKTVLRGHRAEVMAVRFVEASGWSSTEPGLPRLLSAAADGEVRLWSLRTRRPLASVAAHPGNSILSVQAISGARVLTQGRDGFVRLWDANDGLRGPLLQLTTRCYNFCQFACSASLVNWSGTFEAAALDVARDDPLLADESGDRKKTEHDVSAGDASSSGQPLLALPSDDALELLLWDVRDRSPARKLQPSDAHGKVGMCMCARFARGDSMLLSGWEDGSLQTFDLRGTSPPISRRVHTEPVLCVDAHVGGEFVITGAADLKLCVVPVQQASADSDDAAPAGPAAELAIPPSNESSGSGGIASVCVRPDGRIFAAGGWDRRVRLWQWRKWKPLAVLQHHTGTVNGVSFSPCSHWLASGSSDATIALWTLFPPAPTAAELEKN